MKTITALVLVLILTSFLTSCGGDEVLNSNFVIVDNIKNNDDGTFEISLRNGDISKPKTNIHFTSKFRLQAGDTMWSRYQLKEYNIDRLTTISMENKVLKDSIEFLKNNLKNTELENQLLKNYYYSSISNKKP